MKVWTGRLDYDILSQWIFRADFEDVNRGLDCITFIRFLCPDLLLLHLEELVLQLISLLHNESHLILE